MKEYTYRQLLDFYGQSYEDHRVDVKHVLSPSLNREARLQSLAELVATATSQDQKWLTCLQEDVGDGSTDIDRVLCRTARNKPEEGD